MAWDRGQTASGKESTSTTWAIVLDGRFDPSGVLLLSDDRQELESIASEVRRRGHPVAVRPYPARVAGDQRPVVVAKSF